MSKCVELESPRSRAELRCVVQEVELLGNLKYLLCRTNRFMRIVVFETAGRQALVLSRSQRTQYCLQSH